MRRTMSHTQVRADEATTNHEENNYGLFSQNGQWFEPPLLRDGRHSNPGRLLTVQVLEGEPDNQASSKRRDRKAKFSPKTVRSRRVVLDNPPNRTAGANHGQATSVPLYDSQSWRNPGGPIGPPAGNKAAGYAAAKPNNCLLYTSPSPRDRQKSRMPSSA